MNSFYHERLCKTPGTNFLDQSGSKFSKLLSDDVVLYKRNQDYAAKTAREILSRTLESSSSRITRNFSDPVPLIASEPFKLNFEYEDRHQGRQLNGFDRREISPPRKTTSGTD